MVPAVFLVVSYNVYTRVFLDAYDGLAATGPPLVEIRSPLDDKPSCGAIEERNFVDESLLAYLPLSEMERQREESAKELAEIEELLTSLEGRRRALQKTLGIKHAEERKSSLPMEPNFLIPISEFRLEDEPKVSSSFFWSSTADEANRERIAALDYLRFHNARMTKHFTVIATTKGSIILRDEEDQVIVGRKTSPSGIREMRAGGHGDMGGHFIAVLDDEGRVIFHPILFAVKPERKSDGSHAVILTCEFSSIPALEVPFSHHPEERASALIIHEIGPRRSKIVIGSTHGKLHLVEATAMFRLVKDELKSSPLLPPHQHQIFNVTSSPNVSITTMASNHGGSGGSIAVHDPLDNVVTLVHASTGRALPTAPHLPSGRCVIPRLVMTSRKDSNGHAPRLQSLSFDLNTRDSSRLFLGFEDGTLAVLDRRFPLRSSHPASAEAVHKRGFAMRGLFSFLNVFSSTLSGSKATRPMGCHIAMVRRGETGGDAIFPLVGHHAFSSSGDGALFTRTALVMRRDGDASSTSAIFDTETMEVHSGELKGIDRAFTIDTFAFGFGVALIREGGRSGVFFRSAFPRAYAPVDGTTDGGKTITSSHRFSTRNLPDDPQAGAFVAQIPLFVCAGVGLYILYSRGRLSLTTKFDLDEIFESRKQQKRLKEMQREGRVTFLRDPQREEAEIEERLRAFGLGRGAVRGDADPFTAFETDLAEPVPLDAAKSDGEEGRVEVAANGSSSPNEARDEEISQQEEDDDGFDLNGDLNERGAGEYGRFEKRPPRFITTNSEFLEEMRNTKDWTHPPY